MLGFEHRCGTVGPWYLTAVQILLNTNQHPSLLLLPGLYGRSSSFYLLTAPLYFSVNYPRLGSLPPSSPPWAPHGSCHLSSLLLYTFTGPQQPLITTTLQHCSTVQSPSSTACSYDSNGRIEVLSSDIGK